MELCSTENITTIVAGPGGAPERRVALWVSETEVNAFLSVLLNAALMPTVSDELAERLLWRVAEASRAFDYPGREGDEGRGQHPGRGDIDLPRIGASKYLDCAG